eukprot:4970699-Prymnesium_polylepis.1
MNRCRAERTRATSLGFESDPDPRCPATDARASGASRSVGHSACALQAASGAALRVSGLARTP